MNSYSKFYEELNSLQRKTVDAVAGPVLILAGPGTGKTQLLSVRAGSILNKGKAMPENILILTYTNSAAKAMKERLVKVLGLSGYGVEVGTFHSFANTIIQGSEEAANYVGDKIQMDDVERMRAFEYILDNTEGLDEIRPFRAPYTYLKDIIKKIGELKKDGIAPEDIEHYLRDGKKAYVHMEDKYVKRLRGLSIVYRRYEEIKDGRERGIFDERGRYDYDDMILFATQALKAEEPLRREYQAQYRYVMVDEYQDTNASQLELLFALLDYEYPNLCCVGDDDQSIYRFQGASVGNFKFLTKRFPDIMVLSLKENYRSASELIEVSKRIINLIPLQERMAQKELAAVRDYRKVEIAFKEFTTEEEELIYLVDKVRELKKAIEKDARATTEERKTPYNNIAVLVRKRGDILKIIDAFLQAGIPYATDGKEDISGETRVKQLLDVLELAHIQPGEHELKDLALYKVLASDYFQIPHIDILRFMSYATDERRRAKEDASLLEEFLNYFSSKKNLVKFKRPDRLYHAAEAISRLLDSARARPVHAILMDYIKDAGVFKYVLQEYADNKILRIRQLRSLASFVNMVKASDMARPGIRLDDFIQEMNIRKEHGLPIQGSLVTLTQAGVRVYTAHGSKGAEFHSVIIPFCLQNVNWPARPIADKIQLPFDIFKTKRAVEEKEALKQLAMQDETRLFYVAATRAKANLIFTASPTEDSVSSLYMGKLGIKKGPTPYAEEEAIAKSLEAIDSKDPFIGTEEVLKDMVDNLSLNPTRLNTYITCRRKFLYNDVLRLPGPKKKSLVFGNCVHKALEETYKAYMDTRRFPSFQFFKEAFRRELKFQGVDKGMGRDLVNKAETIKEWFEKASKDAVLPIGLERKLLVTIGDNIVFTGKYDKVEWEDEARSLVRIVDYKTGKPDSHLKDIDKCVDLSSDDCDGYLRQLVCYRLLFERDKKESNGRRASSGALVFIEPVSADIRRLGYKKGEYVTKRIEISDEMVRQLDAVIRKVWSDIKTLKFEPLPIRDKDRCGKCTFDTICWRE